MTELPTVDDHSSFQNECLFEHAPQQARTVVTLGIDPFLTEELRDLYPKAYIVGVDHDSKYILEARDWKVPYDLMVMSDIRDWIDEANTSFDVLAVSDYVLNSVGYYGWEVLDKIKKRSKFAMVTSTGFWLPRELIETGFKCFKRTEEDELGVYWWKRKRLKTYEA